MARCGCSGGACSCIVQAGTNITVVGNGSAGLPYVITAASTGFTTANTTTVTMSLSGMDVLSAAVLLDGSPGNLITVATGGLRLDCAAIAACASTTHLTVADTGTIDLTLTGDGSVGTPYTVSGVVLIPALLSTDACNDLGLGTDSKLYMSQGGGGAAAANFGTTTPGTTAIPATQTVIDTASVMLTNTSACRTASVMLTYVANVTVSLAIGQGIAIDLGGTSSVPITHINTGAATTTFVVQATFNDVATVAAGATVTLSAPVSIAQAGTAGGTYSTDSWRVTYLLVTN